jgi:hypothetical protein
MKLRLSLIVLVVLLSLGIVTAALAAAGAAGAALPPQPPAQSSNPPTAAHKPFAAEAQPPQPATLPNGVAWDPPTINVPGDWDGYAVSAPRVLVSGGQYRLWYDGNGPQGWAMGTADSLDGLTWAKNVANPILRPGGDGAWDSYYRGQVSLLDDGGILKMWYSGGGDQWQTGYATSTNGMDWNIYSDNPVLGIGAPGDWDEQEADGPSVILDGGLYKMWFHGCNADYSACSIGYATSPDGINWTKYAGNPVLAGTPGDWDEGFIAWPSVILEGGVYKMWYTGNGSIGYATSPDGTSWTKHPGNPVFSAGWDGAGVVMGNVLLDGATYKMWFRSGSGFTSGIGYAESADGITWTTPVPNPVLQPGDPGLVITVNYAHDWVYATTAPSVPLTLTVSDASGVKGILVAQTNANGEFGSWEWGNWDPNQPNIVPGDSVVVEAGGLTTRSTRWARWMPA